MTRRLRLLLAALAALLLATPALAQPGARVALVVGAGAYRAIPPLANPPNDAVGDAHHHAHVVLDQQDGAA
uniref:hypothetical protein n=1 Tax=Neoroseomonas rubea TaxID=2748666 RepID=UPI0018E05F3D